MQRKEKVRILCIDDEVEITKSLDTLLSLFGYEVFCSNNAVDGTLKAATIENLSLIILDIRILDSSGLSVCKALKENEKTSEIPVVFLSALSTPKEKVEGLKLGAVDYISKPFDSEELLERVKIATRNFKFFNKKTCPENKDYIDKSKKIFVSNGQEISLTKKEYDILNFLMANKGKLTSKHELRRKVWGDITVGSRTIDTHVINLRKKIQYSSVKIKTKFGEGYMLEA